MEIKLRKAIEVSFSLLFFLVPLWFFPRTSELFEFNKIILLYAVTVIIFSLWAITSIYKKQVVFKRTALDIPLLLFLATQGISTILSIDPRTSFLGYYSRWNGGLFSSVCYTFLYFAAVTFLDKKSVLKIIKTALIATLVAGIWGALEHFGHSPSCLLITGNFDVSCWVQDVALRVFATFGQPNWMAAWFTALIFIPISISIEDKKKAYTNYKYLLLSSLFFVVLLFTKSRSGLAAFGIADIVYWIFVLKSQTRKFKTSIIAVHVLFGLIVGLFGSPWTPSLFEFINRQTKTPEVETQTGPALETGGTESGAIRKIVWTGAINVWKIYPIFGSGVETFAYSYYEGRPMAHNLTSEWNFLYNKAHNEYLNYLATTGLLGFVAYLFLIFAILLVFYKNSKRKDNQINSALLAGFISILITNFFGFSVVPISLLFFIFPALSVALQSNKEEKAIKKSEKITTTEALGYAAVCIIGGYLLLTIGKYWEADYLYQKAVDASSKGNFTESLKNINSAIAITKTEPLYHSTLAGFYSDLALASTNDKSNYKQTFVDAASAELDTTIELSPRNVKLLKATANTYEDLGDLDPNYYLKALDILGKLERLAPTDPSVWYQRGLTFAKLDKIDEAIPSIQKTINMKPDYKLARRLLAFLYENNKENDKAREQLQYILKYISPDDKDIQKELDSLK